jgi:hypothetical protein
MMTWQVPQVYRAFGLSWETSYRRFAAQVRPTHTAQLSPPTHNITPHSHARPIPSHLTLHWQAITNAAQQFTPRSFWTARASVEAAILSAVNASIFRDGHAQV